MADYYPLLAKTVPSGTPPTGRRELYDRARKAMIDQLRSLNPPLVEDIIQREEAALDAAVARLEGERGAATESAPPGTRSATKPPPSEPPVKTQPPTAAPRPTSATPSSFPPPRPPAGSPTPSAGARAPAPPPSTAAVSRAAAAPNATAAIAGAPPRPTVATPSAPRYTPPPRPPAAPTPQPLTPPRAPTAAKAPAAAAGAPPLEPAPPSIGPPPARPTLAPASIGPAAGRSFGPPPLIPAPTPGNFEEGQAPVIAAAPAESPAAPPIRANSDSGRPMAPGLIRKRARSPWPWVALMLLIAAVVVAAGFAVLWREKPQDLVIKGDGEPPAKTASGQNKIAERVSGGAATPAAPSSPPSTPPSPSTPASPTAPASPPATTASPITSPAPASSSSAPAVETPIPTVTVPIVPVKPSETAQGAAPPASTAPGLARAAMLLETPNDPQKPKVDIGTAVWSLVPAAAGPAQAAGPAVQAEVDVPDMKMHATLTIRKNIDPSLPATHTMDLRFTFADGAEAKGFKDMALPQLRRDDATTGDAVSGVRVKINDDYFLVGLTRADADAARNLELLNTRNWIDFPLLLNDDHIAKLTFEKGATGQSVIDQAIEAWK